MRFKSPHLVDVRVAVVLAIVIVILFLLFSGWVIIPDSFDILFIHFRLASPTADVSTPNVFPGTSGTLIPRDNTIPIIQNIVEHEEYRGGELTLFKDIHFSDEGGNTNRVVYELISTDYKGISYAPDSISAPPDDQRRGATVTGTWSCGSRR